MQHELSEETRAAVAENVRNRRTILGLSQRDVSRLSGLSEVSISNIENRTRSYIRPSTMRRLAVALETTVPALYGAEVGTDIPLGVDPLTTPEAQQWLSERREWEHFTPAAAWIGAVAEDGLDGLGARAGRLYGERAQAQRDLQQLRREIEQEGPRDGHQGRRDMARDITGRIRQVLEREYRVRVNTLDAVRDAMIEQELERLPDADVFEMYEEADASLRK